MTYDLYPSGALIALRARFPDYQICEFHDHHGRPYLCAVLTPARMDSGLPVLLTATSHQGLAIRLGAALTPHASTACAPPERADTPPAPAAPAATATATRTRP